MPTEDQIRDMLRSVPDDIGAQQRLRALVSHLEEEPPARGSEASLRPPRLSVAGGWAMLAGAASVMVVILLIALVVGRGPSRSPDHNPATEIPTPSISASPSPTDPTGPAPTTATNSAAADVTLTPQAAVANLMELIGAQLSAFSSPAGKVMPGPAPGYITGSVVYDDGGGAALVEVQVSRPPTQSIAAYCTGSQQVCRTLGDGTQVEFEQRSPSSSTTSSATIVRALRPDGVEVDIRQLSSTSDAASPTRAEPPISENDFIAIATSPTWALTITAQAAQSAAGLF